ncbi:unnamed protein product [Periconia digitata]|uniref:T6SS Phospholipase effector Tle1-like catalytic domain-containing protein n=1 Tax=Periconia digitata TaxID=1303443 RepID=A0A9W4XZ93_9PLEO|nr:unnamed protein product [Periconia digitata]
MESHGVESHSAVPLQEQLNSFRENSKLSTNAIDTQISRRKKKFILCFDGTGNKFSGTDSDSNILKIYRMLDRNEDDQFHYYQPGIGTYVTASSMSAGSQGSRLDRIKSWYKKAKDSAVGTSFDEHVMGGYRFLMRYYNAGDEIYFFGFSRGAYTARFLAEMLDHVGLLSAGNEEMCHFAWKTFQRWQCRQERNSDEKQEKKSLLEFMCAFRETFSRPVAAIRFLGLFDTVNSVPRFESAWMQRSKFPYTARSSAKVIRHAVSIDERRAKFRQDLISGPKPKQSNQYKHRRKHLHMRHSINGHHQQTEESTEQHRGRNPTIPSGRRDTLAVPERYRSRSETAGVRSRSPGYSERSGHYSPASSVSNLSLDALRNIRADDTDDEGPQDIKEVWFPGCHADIGGGWPLDSGEDVALSHVPLFDEIKVHALNCTPASDPEPDLSTAHENVPSIPIPTIEVDPASPPAVSQPPLSPRTRPQTADPEKSLRSPPMGNDYQFPQPPSSSHHHFHAHSKFHTHLHTAATQGRIHDVLQLRNGVPALSVLSWNIMEYLPFRRMDLQDDGSWKAIVWPLPKGEVRDIPEDAIIHRSVIKRMEADPNYRPGNLIVGGGGRGVRKAPPEMGTGKWKVVCEEGHAVGECYVRSEKPVKKKEVEGAKMLAVAPNGPQGTFLFAK